MSVLIKGMKMPKTEAYILSVDNTGKDKTIFAIVEHTHSGKIILRYVGEAISVPPHGRLIDADALIELYEPAPEDVNEWEWEHYMTTVGVIRQNIKDAPTVIEAEGE